MGSISRRILIPLLVAVLSLATIPIAQAASSAHIVETQPAASATLGRQQSFWVRIEYRTDDAISLWVRPYRDGTQVKDVFSNVSLTYTGSGEALGWFALRSPGNVDEIRIVAGGGQPFREWELARVPVELHWTEATPADVPQAQWVAELLAAEKSRYDDYARQQASEPVSTGGLALFSGFMLAVLALFVAGIGVPLWSMWKWRGGWRLAAAVPAAVVLFVVARIIIDTARDPTSHNLWPFEILQFGVVALVIIGLLKLARRYLGVQS